MIFAAAYTDLNQKKTIATVIDAKGEFEAMIEAVVANTGEDMREWLNRIPRKKKVFLKSRRLTQDNG